MSKERSNLDVHIDAALARFFYGKIIQALLNSEQALVEEENFEGAAIVRDEILKLKEELKRELNE